MTKITATHSLLHDGVRAIVDLVEQTHVATARKPVRWLRPVPLVGPGAQVVGAVHDGVAKLVYGSVRAVHSGVAMACGAALSAARVMGLERAGEELGLQVEPDTRRELARWEATAQSALNAWVGDFLERRGNGLSIRMGFYRAGSPLPPTRAALAAAIERPTRKVCIFVHGLACTEDTWRFRAAEQYGDPEANYGTFLARDLGYTPLYVRYNTGRHISDNARDLVALIAALVAAYPGELDELALVGHSMGGLVARGAAHYAARAEEPWASKLRHVLCIGSPHLGAPLEQATHQLSSLLSRVDLAGTTVPAKLLDVRSAGIKDLRHGYVLEQDWAGKDPGALQEADRSDVPLVDAVVYGFIAANFLRDADHPLGAWLGDLLVRVPSASGRAADTTRHVPFHLGEVVHGVHHIAMLNHPAVYAQLRRLLSERAQRAAGALAAAQL